MFMALDIDLAVLNPPTGNNKVSRAADKSVSFAIDVPRMNGRLDQSHCSQPSVAPHRKFTNPLQFEAAIKWLAIFQPIQEDIVFEFGGTRSSASKA